MSKSIYTIGDTEMEVLNHVWELGEASVSDIHERILRNRKVAYTTIMTVTKNLADKGYLSYRKEGISYIYKALKKPDNVKHSVLSNIVSKVFKGSPAALVQNLVEHENMTPDEINKLQELIDKMRE